MGRLDEESQLALDLLERERRGPPVDVADVVDDERPGQGVTARGESPQRRLGVADRIVDGTQLLLHPRAALEQGVLLGLVVPAEDVAGPVVDEPTVVLLVAVARLDLPSRRHGAGRAP